METDSPNQIETDLRSLELLNLTSVEIFGKMGTPDRETQFDNEIDQLMKLLEEIDPETTPAPLKEKLSRMIPHVVDVLLKIQDPTKSIPKSLKIIKKTLGIFFQNTNEPSSKQRVPTVDELYSRLQTHRQELSRQADELRKYLEAICQGHRQLSDSGKQDLADYTFVITSLLEKVATHQNTPANRAEALTLLRLLLKIITA
ncbi:MAG: hypothetical protein ABII07_03145 [Patescibacteria group bacterium]|nr:hypothetical protein [Patescibacteria group bacterium]